VLIEWNKLPSSKNLNPKVLTKKRFFILGTFPRKIGRIQQGIQNSLSNKTGDVEVNILYKKLINFIKFYVMVCF